MEHFSFNTGILDLILIILGFLIGQATKLKTPIMVLILIIRMAKWYLDTHPNGKRMAKQTDIDEKLQKLFTDNQIDGLG